MACKGHNHRSDCSCPIGARGTRNSAQGKRIAFTDISVETRSGRRVHARPIIPKPCRYCGIPIVYRRGPRGQPVPFLATESNPGVKHSCSNAPKAGKSGWVTCNIARSSDGRDGIILHSIIFGSFRIALEAETEFDFDQQTLVRALAFTEHLFEVAYQDSITKKPVNPYMFAERLD